jgi:glycosyltransferase involved in cell wall biosynthesis
MYTDQELPDRIGREAYSYRFVERAFAPLLERWGQVIEVNRPESRLDFALMKARQEHLAPIHLSFLPLHRVYLTHQAPNVVFPFWEFPDIPNRTFKNNLRNNWVHVAQHVSLLLTACNFTRGAFVRAGVQAPVRVVPVPIPAAYFTVPDWQPDQKVVLDCPAYVLPGPAAPVAPPPSAWEPAPVHGVSWKTRAKQTYKWYIKPRIPGMIDHYMALGARALAAGRAAQAAKERISLPAEPRLELAGVVYTIILNPFDLRKNWQDLLSALLLSLGERPDVTLVFKLVVCPELAPQAINGMLHYYHRLGLEHRCKVVFLPHFLSDEQMVQLAQASTYYVNATRAEGACLPLQNFLAARRPGISPLHTAMIDYFRADLGFVVDSHPEPACWPHDPEEKLSTRWHRLVWQSLHDQLRASYDLARQDLTRYRAQAARGRERMQEHASAERVWPSLAAALSLAIQSERITDKSMVRTRIAS